MKNQSNLKTIFLVEHGDIYKEFTLKHLHSKGYRLVIFTTKKIELLQKYTTDEYIIVCDTFDYYELVNCALAFMSETDISPDLITTFKESSVISAAFLADTLGYPGPGLGAAMRSSQNKLNMRRYLEKKGFINQPDFRVFNIYNVDNFVVDRDLVIKPLFGSSSHGVIKLSAGDDFKKNIEIARITMIKEEREVFKKFNGRMLVEEYIEGYVLSVDGVVITGETFILGATDFIMGEEPFFTQEASIIPSLKADEVLNLCYEKTREVISILGFQTCGFHCEWRIKNDIPYLLEVAARPAGGGIMLGYEKVFNVNLIDLVIDALLGVKSTNLKPNPNCRSIQKSVFPKIDQDSILMNINMINLEEKESDVWHFLPFAKERDVMSYYPKTPSQLYYFAFTQPMNIGFHDIIKKMKDIENIITYETKTNK